MCCYSLPDFWNRWTKRFGRCSALGPTVCGSFKSGTHKIQTAKRFSCSCREWLYCWEIILAFLKWSSKTYFFSGRDEILEGICFGDEARRSAELFGFKVGSTRVTNLWGILLDKVQIALLNGFSFIVTILIERKASLFCSQISLVTWLVALACKNFVKSTSTWLDSSPS